MSGCPMKLEVFLKSGEPLENFNKARPCWHVIFNQRGVCVRGA